MNDLTEKGFGKGETFNEFDDGNELWIIFTITFINETLVFSTFAILQILILPTISSLVEEDFIWVKEITLNF